MSEFDEARRAALISDLLRLLRGLPRDLLRFDNVREKLRLRSVAERGIQEVPLGRIIGSLGREREFNRIFLPREEALRDRWEEVHDMAQGPEGFQSVELYQVGDAYFVIDGHHRVSVARALGAPTIEAHVREFLSDVPIQPEDSIEELVLRRGRADFLEATGIESGPDDFRVTEPDGYERLLDHISKHRYYLGLEQKRDIGWQDAVLSWRTHVYNPMIEIIRHSGVLEQFAG
ncbi:MAG: hypothetical protein ACXW29_11735, partial [Thermoanaerobaculia bacterium]